jgi:peptide/nickel transport system ATP-binding protein
METPILQAQNLIKHFPITRGLLFMKQIGAIKAVDGIDFTINRGETFGLVGESGCGKTTTAKLILLLESVTDGSILFEGHDITKMSDLEFKRYRSQVQAVFQDPYSSLSPRMRIGSIIAEPLIVHKQFTRHEIRDKTSEVLKVVGLQGDHAERYPHEFSGGQRQRIAVARALALNPKLILLDEPVSALDVSIRAQIMNLLKDIQEQFGLTYLLIAHDLAVVKHMSNWIGVMYLGKLVETAESQELYRNPLHPYTQALLSAALPSHPDDRKNGIILSGEVPSPLHIPPGCRFHTRCPMAREECSWEVPALKEISPGHQVACHRPFQGVTG